MKKFLSLLLVAMCLLTSFGMCFATTLTPGAQIDPNVGAVSNKLDSPVRAVLGVIKWAGYIIAAGMIIYIGIKYLMASASEKADLKGLAIKYVIGAVLIVFGTTIASWIFSINASAV